MVMEEQVGSSGLDSESLPVPSVQDSAVEGNEAVGNENQLAGGKSRHRKKALHAQILKQMEFYFSDANLSKDRFLANMISTDPYVDLDIFLRCNKIRSLTEDKERIVKALKNSTMLAVSEDGKKVRRVTPIGSRENAEACTIYVQNLPPDITHDWVINLFSPYGSVAYVSLPRYKSNRKLKGFAFVEFNAVESAEKCLKAFDEKGYTLPSHTEPHKLLSITTFSEDDPPPDECDNAKLGSEPIPQKIKATKRPLDLDQSASPCEPVEEKKPRLNGCDNEKNDNEESDNPKNLSMEDLMSINADGNKDVDMKNKKRKRKRRDKAEQVDAFDFGLNIMAKRDWKKSRNKYLELQRSKMKQLKQHLRKTRWGSQDKKEKMETGESAKLEPEIEPTKSSPAFIFAKGLIFKIDLDEPCCNPKSFKQQFRGDSGVEYIDVKEGVSCVYIRCNTAETAENLAKKYSEDKSVCILEGDEEKAYWEKISRDRAVKFSSQNRPKQRGRDKLLKKAEKELGKHIRFDEV